MQRKIITLFILTTICASGQQNWKWMNPLPQGNTINNITIIDDNNIIAVGDNGFLIKSIDAGINWTVVQTGYANNLQTSFFTDKVNGWLAGENGIILKTTDGGLSFTRQDTGGVS